MHLSSRSTVTPTCNLKTFHALSRALFRQNGGSPLSASTNLTFNSSSSYFQYFHTLHPSLNVDLYATSKNFSKKKTSTGHVAHRTSQIAVCVATKHRDLCFSQLKHTSTSSLSHPYFSPHLSFHHHATPRHAALRCALSTPPLCVDDNDDDTNDIDEDVSFFLGPPRPLQKPPHTHYIASSQFVFSLKESPHFSVEREPCVRVLRE